MSETDRYIKKIEEQGFKKINNYGQFNCGIFITKDKLIKCDAYNRNRSDLFDELNIKLENSGMRNIFPKVYDVKILNGTAFTEMQKLDGDLTNLMFEIIPQNILKNNVNREKIYNIYQYKLPQQKLTLYLAR